MKKIPMQYPYGAVYFRKSNPPKADWERDYAQAAADGNNIFRHWFMWGSIETAPGMFDWADYDRQMELAQKNGLKVIIAEISTSVPEWLHHGHPELLHVNRDGSRPGSHFGVSSATGGFCGGLCLDNAEGRKLTERFLRALASRYRGHPALLGYDIWNECSVSPAFCHCECTAAKFRQWLAAKYGSLGGVSEAWHRYSFTDWAQVKIPDSLYLAPECFDWLEFKKENAYEQFRWRIATLREEDPESLMCAHGMALSLENMANGASDEWLSAAPVDVYGLTFVQSRKGAAAWKQFLAVDLTRSGAKETPFWHAEAQGGPLWLQPQLPGRPRDDGRITRAEDLRFWNMTSLACGARGTLYPRWRPLLDGALFGAFGPYGMDGRPTPCSEMGSRLAKWGNAPAQRPLMEAAPIAGELGLVVVPESQTASLLLSQNGAADNYRHMMSGAYRCFFDINIQADFVHIDDIDGGIGGAAAYRFLYVPYPLMLKASNANRLLRWVGAGGNLVCEGCPGYFSDLGHAGAVQPNLGLDALFGVRQETVEFTPDLLGDFSFALHGDRIFGAEYLQTYAPDGAAPIARLDDGRIFATRNTYGKGTAILIGTCVSKGYSDHPASRSGAALEEIFGGMGFLRRVVSDNNEVVVRIQAPRAGTCGKSDGAGGRERFFLWLMNPTRRPQNIRFELRLDGFKEFCDLETHWEGGTVEHAGANRFSARVDPQDCIVFSVLGEPARA
ncbi:MAG: beta-galactosidase [Clostridiales bacterium]|jgi:beta-galactosidase|nr:beta-galactosidase [Clostridiales bacterium]